MPAKIDGAFFDIDSAAGDALGQLKDALRLDDITYYGFTKQAAARVGRDPFPADNQTEPSVTRVLSNPEHLYYDAAGVLWTIDPSNAFRVLRVDPNDFETISHDIGPDPLLNRHAWVYNFSCRADYLDVSNENGRLKFEREAAAPTTLTYTGRFIGKRQFRADRGFDVTWEFRDLPNPAGQYIMAPLLASRTGIVGAYIVKQTGSSFVLFVTENGPAGAPVAIPDGTTEMDIRFSWDPLTATVSVTFITGGAGTLLASRTFATLPESFINILQCNFPNYDTGANLIANFGMREPVYHPERNDTTGRYATGAMGLDWVEGGTPGSYGIHLAGWAAGGLLETSWEDLGSIDPIIDSADGLVETPLFDIEGAVQVGAGIFVDGVTSRRVLHWNIIGDYSRMEWQENVVAGLNPYRCASRQYNIPLPTGIDEDDIFLGSPAMINGAICLVFGVKYSSGDGQTGIYILDFHADALLHVTEDGAYYDMVGLGSQIFHGFLEPISTPYTTEEFRAPALVRDHVVTAAKPAFIHSAKPTADLSNYSDTLLLNRKIFITPTQRGVAPHTCFAFQAAYADVGTLLITGYEHVKVIAPPIGLQDDARRWNFSGPVMSSLCNDAYTESQGPISNKFNLTGISAAFLGIPSLWFPTARYGGSPTQNGFPRMTPFHQIPGWFFVSPGNLPGGFFKYLSAQGYAQGTVIPAGMSQEEYMEQQKNLFGEANVGDEPATLGLSLNDTVGTSLAFGRGPILTDGVQQYDAILRAATADGDIVELDTFYCANYTFDAETDIDRTIDITVATDPVNVQQVEITKVLDSHTVQVAPALNSTENGVTWEFLTSVFELQYEGADASNEVETTDLLKHLGVVVMVVCDTVKDFYRVKNVYPREGSDGLVVLKLEPLLLDGEDRWTFALPRNNSAYLTFLPMPWNVDIDGVAVDAVPVAFQDATDLTDPETLRYWVLLRSVDGSVAELRRYQFHFDYDAQVFRAVFDRRFTQNADDQTWVGDEDFLSRSSTQDFFMLGSENLTESSTTLYGTITGREVEVASGSEESDRPYYFLKGTCWNWRDAISLTWTMRLTTGEPTTDGSTVPSPLSADNTTVQPLGAGAEIRLGAQMQDKNTGPVAHVSLLQQTAPYTMPRQGTTGDSAAGYLPGMEGEGEWVNATTFRAFQNDGGPPVFSSFLEDMDPSVAERLLVVYDQANPRKRLLLRVEEVLAGNEATVSTDLNTTFKAFAGLTAWTTDIPESERVEGTRFSWFFFLWRGSVTGGKLTFPNVFQATRKPFGGRLAFADEHVGDFLEVGVVLNPTHFYPDLIPDAGYTTAYWASGDDTVYLRDDLGEVFTRGMLGHSLYMGGTEEEVYIIADLIEERGAGMFLGAVLENIGGGTPSFLDDQTAQIVRFDSHVVENGVKGRVVVASADEFYVEPYTSGVHLVGTELIADGTTWIFDAAEEADLTSIAVGMKMRLATDGWWLISEVIYTSGVVTGVKLVNISTGAAFAGTTDRSWEVYEIADMRNYFAKGLKDGGTVIVMDKEAHGTVNNGEHTIVDTVPGTEIKTPTYPSNRPGAYAGMELATPGTLIDQSDLSWKAKGTYVRWEIDAVLSGTSVELNVPTQATFDAMAAFAVNGRFAWKHVTKRLQLPRANFVALDADQKKLTLDKSGDPDLDGYEFDIEEVESATQIKVDHYFDAPLLNSGAVRWGIGDVPYATVAYLPDGGVIPTAINGGTGGIYALLPRGGTLPTDLVGKYLYLNFPYLDEDTAISEGLFNEVTYAGASLTLSPALNAVPVKVLATGNHTGGPPTYGYWALLDLETDSVLLEPLNDEALVQVYAWPVNLGYTQAEYVPALYLGEAKHVYADTLAANWEIFQNPGYMRIASLAVPPMSPLCYMKLETVRENERTKVTVTRLIVGKERTEEENFFDPGEDASITLFLNALTRSATPAAPGTTFGYRGDKFPAGEGFFLNVAFAQIVFSTTSQHLAEDQLGTLVGIPELLSASPSPRYNKSVLWVGSNTDQQGAIVTGDQDRVLQLFLREDVVSTKEAQQLDSAEVLGDLVEYTRHAHGTRLSVHLQTAATLFYNEDLTLADLQGWYEKWG